MNFNPCGKTLKIVASTVVSKGRQAAALGCTPADCYRFFNSSDTVPVYFTLQSSQSTAESNCVLPLGYETRAITGVTQANPGVLTYTGSDPSNGQVVTISDVTGMTELNGNTYTVANVNAGANTFELGTTDTTAYGAYVSGGTYTIAATDRSILFLAPLETMVIKGPVDAYISTITESGLATLYVTPGHASI